MASMQPVLRRYAQSSPDSLIATMLPELGDAPDLGRVRLAGNHLRDTFNREDPAALATFVKAALRGGWTNPRHHDCFSLGDDDAALRVVAHDAAWAIGTAISGQPNEALPDHVAKKIVHASAPVAIQRVDMLPILKVGSQLGLYTPEALTPLLTNERGITNALTEWWIEQLLETVQHASPLSDRHDCQLAAGITSRRSGDDLPDSPVHPYLTWGLATDMAVFSMNLPAGEAPTDIHLRDLILLVCAAHQAVACDFGTPSEAGASMMGYVWEDDIQRVREELNGAPATEQRVREILLRELPNEAHQPGGGLSIELVSAHCTYESLLAALDQGDQEDQSSIDEWCQGIARLIAADAWMQNPLHQQGGLKDKSGDWKPIEVMTHVQSRIATELPTLHGQYPEICDTLALWAGWLADYAERGGRRSFDVLNNAEAYIEESIPMEYLIQAYPGIFPSAEMAAAEQTWEHIMSGAGTQAVFDGGFDNVELASTLVDAMICINTLVHFLLELTERLGGHAETPSII